MDSIQHHQILVRELKLYTAEIGTGSRVVILLHGFPEIWYTWRHQMVALANAGYRAIAPDYRGYGLSDKPTVPGTTSFMDLVDDLLGIMNQLDIFTKVFIIAKDFGIRVGCLFALIHPNRVQGVVTLGLPYVPLPTPRFPGQAPQGCYISRWQEPGRAEADFNRFDVKTVIKRIYILFSKSELPVACENQEIMDLVEPSTPLPPWFSEEDLAYYGSMYENSGFDTPLQVPYRCLNEVYDILDPVSKHPVLMIMGRKDYSLNFPGVKEYIENGKVKEYVPNLEMALLPEGTHFAHEQLPGVVNKLILDFLAHNYALHG